jgi:RNA polymerase sigma-70 factor, ECF subfamily
MEVPDTGADAKALERLCDQHAVALWRYAWRLTGDRGRARDVVQETLLQAWQRPHILDNGNSTRGWLFTVAKNMIIDERRSVRFVMSPEGSGPPELAGSHGVSGMLNRVLVGEAMGQLSAEHRAVVARSYYRGWTTAQIAADIGVAEDTVMLRLHYALRALRQVLLEMGLAP